MSMSSYRDDDYDICLFYDDYELNIKTGELKIDKSVFDDFEENAVIMISFPDENGEPTIDYIMRSEDDDWIYCEYLG